MRKLNFVKGITRIYYIIVVLAMIPSVWVVRKEYVRNNHIEQSLRRAETQLSKSQAEIAELTSRLGITSILLDRYLTRTAQSKDSDFNRFPDFKYEFALLSFEEFDSLCDNDNWRTETPPEIVDYVDKVVAYSKDKMAVWRLRHSLNWDNTIRISIVLGSIIFLPPICYLTFIGFIDPFFRWIGRGFVDKSGD